ncbi:MAG: diacylglycerol kinase family protein [Verrucomicrobiales bacterium]|nr:diacylglycerol kinase family protein [Verrucomicrobiales bacterium]
MSRDLFENAIVVLNQDAGGVINSATESPGKHIETFFEKRKRKVKLMEVPPTEIETVLSELSGTVPSLIIAAGGDGTVSACAKAAIDLSVPLGILPMGTFNHVARDMKIPLDLEEAIDALSEGQVSSIDVGSVNGRQFLSACVLGFYPDKIYTDEDRGQLWWHKISRYFFTGLRILPHYRPMNLRFETHSRVFRSRTSFVVISNNPYLDQAGVMPAKEEFDSGNLGLYVSTHHTRRELMEAGKAFLLGSLLENPDLKTEKAPQVTVYSRKKCLKTLVDGELFNFTTPLTFNSNHCSLQVVRPVKLL